MTADELLKMLACGSSGCECSRSLARGFGKSHCPAHEDRTPSLAVSVRNGNLLWRCHAGCSQDQVTAAIAERTPRPEPARQERRQPARREVATYDYVDEQGVLLYQAVRYEPKDFRQRRPTPEGGWTWSLNGQRRVLYRLPELLQHARRAVYLVEGEKDADRLSALGLLATTYAGGAKAHWQAEWTEQLAGRKVVVVADADDPGLAKAVRDARQLRTAAAAVKLVELPGLERRRDHGQDVSDWLDLGHTREDLLALVGAAPAFTEDVERALLEPDPGPEEPPAPADPQPPEATDEVLEPTGWEPVDVAAVLAGSTSAVEPTVLRRSDGQPLLYPGRTHALYGPPESLKSWAASVAVAEVLRAGDFVLVLDHDGEAIDFVNRQLALGIDRAVLVERLDYRRPSAPLSDEAMTQLLAAAGRRRFGLVVLDGLDDALVLAGCDPNSAREVRSWWHRFLRPLQASVPGPIVLIDQVVKDREQRGQWAAGSYQKLASIDGASFGFELLQHFGRGRSGAARLILQKDRVGALRPLQAAASKDVALLRLDSLEDGSVVAELAAPATSTSAPAGEAPAWQPSGYMARISKLLEESADGIGFNALREALGGKRDYVRKALDALAAGGFIEVIAGPRGSTIHRSVKPFREAPVRLVPDRSPLVPEAARGSVGGLVPEGTLPLTGGSPGDRSSAAPMAGSESLPLIPDDLVGLEAMRDDDYPHDLVEQEVSA